MPAQVLRQARLDLEVVGFSRDADDNGPVGLDSRDYMNQDEGDGASSGLLGGLSATWKLILINLVVWLAWQIWPRSTLLYDHFMVSPDGLLEQHRLWTVFTYSFSQRELWHLFWNMLFLHWFGSDLEQVYGRKNVYVVYLVGALGGALAQVAFSLYQGDATRPMLGASASVMGIVICTTLLFPTRKIMIWGVVPSPLWALAAVYVAVDVLGLAKELQGSFSRVGHAGHLGGAVAGALFKLLDLRPFRRQGLPGARRAGGASGGPFTWLKTAWRRRHIRVLPPLRDEEQHVRIVDEPPPAPVDTRIDPELEARVDDLLRKINAEGLQSLSPEEKAFLEKASARYKR